MCEKNVVWHQSSYVNANRVCFPSRNSRNMNPCPSKQSVRRAEGAYRNVTVAGCFRRRFVFHNYRHRIVRFVQWFSSLNIPALLILHNDSMSKQALLWLLAFCVWSNVHLNFPRSFYKFLCSRFEPRGGIFAIHQTDEEFRSKYQ